VTIQSSTFHPPASKESILAAIERQREHVADLTSYLCYLIPLAERFGGKVYDVAATALSERGLDVTASQLQKLAGEFSGTEGEERYREARLRHTSLFLTNCKGRAGTFSADD